MENEKCNLCPHKCNVNRNKTQGFCKCADNIKIALVSVHDFEEPCISGDKGSGTIFFTGCNLKCVYCQNYEISDNMKGKEVTVERLADIMLEQQERGVENINLVTPTMYIDKIIEAIKIAKNKGLILPIVYNSGGYEKVETLEKIDSYIDIYLPDFKYSSNELGKRYSNVNNYTDIAKKALKFMKEKKSKNVYDNNGILKKGLIIRHMILPNNIENTKNVITWIKQNLGEETCISIMAQYFPTHKSKLFAEINRKIAQEELDEVEEFLIEQNMVNGFIQELGEHEEEYVPEFNLDNV